MNCDYSLAIDEDWGKRVTIKPTYYLGDKTNHIEEKGMSLVDRYKKTKLGDSEKYARKIGAIDDSGELTEEGRNLLLEILFEDKEIQEKFYKVLESLQDNMRGSNG